VTDSTTKVERANQHGSTMRRDVTAIGVDGTTKKSESGLRTAPDSVSELSRGDSIITTERAKRADSTATTERAIIYDGIKWDERAREE